ncbi:glycosyltransferase family 17 [Fadolivirus algeromassiliense]|jgi:beta-1,4-mannosyl-glycoprotein beta-1,4-N-acetylglucosaminyltransferase|uniref:Glycosyltransferase family 17 n=1 Tax=Fadolivirus FV1/VV64 TaxID=3070911 RepID=A0A7D3UUV4_9VIRU|nr:glycosyltransferase family 17 [Fadolivirus algeromassiliense]QKF94411.1 glycosyltransferase family 17 [Fadolivirus FV1/VV64]
MDYKYKYLKYKSKYLAIKQHQSGGNTKINIIDCFPFFNEIELLTIRLEELYDVVDYFVLVESRKTFKGNSKPLYYNDNKDKFKKYNDKIIHIIIDLPNDNSQWGREIYQRNSIDLGIKKINCNDNDIIIISDLDEIPSNNLIKKIRNGEFKIANDTYYHLLMTLYYYNVETMSKRMIQRATIVNYYTYRQTNSPQTIVESKDNNKLKLIKVPDGGWHLSYFGGNDLIMDKLKNLSDAYLLKIHGNKTLDFIEKSIKDNKFIYGNEQLTHVPHKINTNLPKALLYKIS